VNFPIQTIFLIFRQLCRLTFLSKPSIKYSVSCIGELS
jgi:hypothetical protein